MKTDFIDDNNNVLLKMENSGTLNVKYMIIFDGFPLQVHLLQSPEETLHDIAGLCKLYSKKIFLKTFKGDLWHFQFLTAVSSIYLWLSDQSKEK